jgi:hypothetical protein
VYYKPAADVEAKIAEAANNGEHGPCVDCGLPSYRTLGTLALCYVCHSRTITNLMAGGAEPYDLPDPVDPTLKAILINWSEFWQQDYSDEQWLAWPLLPKGRQVVIYAPAKAGKSLLILDVVAALATGGDILGQKNMAGPVDVLYLDYEMTPADLYERMDEMGYGPHSDLSHLHYASLPILPPLNTPEGARAVRELAQGVGAQLVVVDTLSRAVEGDSNHQDTVNEFYKWTGLCLKADGVALCRVDHAGKDLEKGQIGSSAKTFDVDVVWQLTKSEENARVVKRTHTRVGWVPDVVNVTIHENPLRHKVESRGFVAGSQECVDLLRSLGHGPGVSTRDAQRALRDAGQPRARRVVVDACRHLRDQLGLEALVNQHDKVENGHLVVPEPPDLTWNGNHRQNQQSHNGSEQVGTTTGTTQNHQLASEVLPGSVYRTEPAEPDLPAGAEADTYEEGRE